MKTRDYMELAVRVMKDSMAEPRTDGKLSPYVGAVLVRPDGTWEAACRGELRDGDHAEYTLLERKNRATRLDGSTLFVTLEPCAPGARGSGKLSCAERVVLARIKCVYVGVADPDPTVNRRGIKYMQDNGVDVHMFDRDLQEVIEGANAEFFSQALERAQQTELETAQPVELSTLDGRSGGEDYSDLSETALATYRDRARISAVGDALKQNLQRQGLLLQSASGALQPSLFGLLLFGKSPREVLPQAGLLATIRHPDGGEEVRDFDGALVLVPEEVEAWLSARLPSIVSRNQMRREGTGRTLPFEVVREAVVNALVHRDYEIEGAKCQIVVDSDTIVVRSPGAPVAPITLEQMQSFTAPMLSRNPRIHYVFAKMQLAEERGLGMRSLASRAKQAGLPLPRYSWEAPYLNLTLFRSEDSVVRLLPPSASAAMTAQEQEGWQWFAGVGETKSADYAAALDIDVRTARRHMARFVDLGLARREGAGPATMYRIN